MEDYHAGNSLSQRPLKIPEGTLFTDTLLKFFNYKKLAKLYAENPGKDALSLTQDVLDKLHITIDVPEEDLENIPSNGPFIAVSNHPFKGIDSMILMKLVCGRRNDFRILGSRLLHSIEPMRDVVIPVNTSEINSRESSYAGIRFALKHLEEGHCIGMFPTAEDSAPWISPTIVIDPEWSPAAMKLLKLANVPVVPVYFHGTVNRLTNLIRKVNILQGKAGLPEELISKKKRIIKVRIGAPIPSKELASLTDPLKYSRYVRARVYSLGRNIEKPAPFRMKITAKKADPEPVVEKIPRDILEKEFESISPGYRLFETKNYSVVCAPVDVIPNIFREIGRLREITFRDVGEGTGKSIDIDEYDFYYYHLFIWDTDEKAIVGAYRLGKGKEIIDTYGIPGFYINSLFGIRKDFSHVLSESIELGRSFITKEYQRKPIPLFLLWKGIMVFLLKNTEYRYLIGPVSISNDLSKFSKNLIVDFIRTYFFDEILAKSIIPKKDFKSHRDKIVDRKLLIDTSERDINKLEKVIIDVEPGYRIPVLLKKYLEINGKIIGFNIDPAFNNCLDGLLVLDLYDTPGEFLKGLSREMNDPSILERFRK